MNSKVFLFKSFDLECILRNIKLSFEDIAGNNFAKEVINETMVNPTLYPKLYVCYLMPLSDYSNHSTPRENRPKVNPSPCKTSCSMV